MKRLKNTNVVLLINVLIGRRGRKLVNFLFSPVSRIRYAIRRKVHEYRRLKFYVKLYDTLGIETPGVTRDYTREDIEKALASRPKARLDRLEARVKALEER